MSKLSFSQIYNRLNPAQKEAVDAIDGPVMVVAGPGTGKTQVLAARIANILKKTDTNPKSILALTFTESAAKNMRERVVSMIGLDGYKVNINTFHGFCKQVIGQNPEYFPFSLEAEVISALEQYQLVHQLLDSGNYQLLKPLKHPTLYVRSIISAISDLKREGVNPESFAQLIEIEFAQVNQIKNKQRQRQKQKQQAKNLELLDLYRRYEVSLHQTGRYDFNDMIMMVLEALTKYPDLLLDYQENLLYFLVDEYQDTNSAQNQVVFLLAAYWQDKANLFVVGDPHQSIFRFQGASLANINLFLSRYPKAKIINLDTGYRCPQPVYNAAFELINKLESDSSETEHEAVFGLLQFNRPLQLAQSIKQSGADLPELYAAPTQLSEYIYLANKIKQLIHRGIKPESIAVLYRDNRESLPLMEVFDKWGVNYDVAGGGNALEVEEIRQLLQYLRLIYLMRQGSKDLDLFEVLSYDWIGVDSLLVMKLARLAHQKRVDLATLIEMDDLKVTHGQGVTQLTPLDRAPVKEFLDQLHQFGALDLKTTFVHFFETIIQQTGYLDWLLTKPNKHELILALNALFSEIKALNYSNHRFKLVDFIQAMELMQQYRLVVKIDDFNLTEGAVTLSTVHKAKGLEWDYVFVIGLVDGRWGNKRKIGAQIQLPSSIVDAHLADQDQEAEMKRLFYVAITRAAKKLYLSYPQTLVENGSVREYLPSKFVSFFQQNQLVKETNYSLDQDLEKNLAKLLAPAPKKLKASQNQRAFFKHLVNQFTLSVSALNKYLSDPKAFALETLLKVPAAKPANMGYGTAIHKALELTNRFLIKTGQLPSLEKIISYFQQALQEELIPESEYERWLQRGQEALTLYYHQRLAPTPTAPLQAEKPFYNVYLDDIRLTGKLDRVEWLDAQRKWVRVIDYKTGNARTTNEIEAKTKTAKKYLSERELELPEFLQGSYKRQLLFYKILADLDPSFPYLAKQGAFDFVEPKNEKLTPLRVFEFVDEEVEAMKQLIKAVMIEIRGLKFLEELS